MPFCIFSVSSSCNYVMGWCQLAFNACSHSLVAAADLMSVPSLASTVSQPKPFKIRAPSAAVPWPASAAATASAWEHSVVATAALAALAPPAVSVRIGDSAFEAPPSDCGGPTASVTIAIETPRLRRTLSGRCVRSCCRVAAQLWGRRPRPWRRGWAGAWRPARAERHRRRCTWSSHRWLRAAAGRQRAVRPAGLRARHFLRPSPPAGAAAAARGLWSEDNGNCLKITAM